jgi:hypothetical protein
VSKLKPVILDEGLVDFEALLVGREQGYTGVAIKTCKGHTDSLLLAAAAQKFGMLVCAQDLTCPGYSYLHYASLAARLPKVDAFEANGRQYAAPRVNKEWAKRFPDAFEVINGTVRTETLDAIGLGF